MSFQICSIPNCWVRYVDSAVLHCFPNPNTELERFQEWITSIGGELMTLDKNYVYKNKRICDKHFEQIYYGSKNRLLKTAVPTLYLPGVPLHRFPNPDKDIKKFKIWISSIGGALTTLDYITIYENRRVCHKHFQDIHKYPKNKLCRLATPLLRMPDIRTPSVTSREMCVDSTATVVKDDTNFTSGTRTGTETAVSNKLSDASAAGLSEKNTPSTVPEPVCEEPSRPIRIVAGYSGQVVTTEVSSLFMPGLDVSSAPNRIQADFNVDIDEDDAMQDLYINNMSSTSIDNELSSGPETSIDNELSSELETSIDNELSSELEISIDNKLSSEPETSIDNELSSELEISIDNELSSKPETSIDNELSSEPEISIENELSSKLETSLDNKLSSEPETSIDNELSSKPESSIDNELSSEPAISHAIIARVYHYLQKEYECLKTLVGGSCDVSPFADILRRTAEATGVTENTVTSVLQESKCAEHLDDLDNNTSRQESPMDLNCETYNIGDTSKMDTALGDDVYILDLREKDAVNAENENKQCTVKKNSQLPSKLIKSHFVARSELKESDGTNSEILRKLQCCRWCSVRKRGYNKNLWMCKQCKVSLCLNKCFRNCCRVP